VPIIKPFNVLYHRSEGCLYYTYPSIFNSKFEKVKIKTWEENLQSRVLDNKGWRTFTPQDLVLIVHDKKNLVGRDIIEFLEQVPLEIQELATPYQ